MVSRRPNVSLPPSTITVSSFSSVKKLKEIQTIKLKVIYYQLLKLVMSSFVLRLRLAPPTLYTIVAFVGTATVKYVIYENPAMLRMHAMALRLREIGTSRGTTTVLPKARGSQRNSKPPTVAVALLRPLYNIKFPSAKMRLSRKGGNSKKNKVSGLLRAVTISPIVGFYEKLRCCLR